MSSSCAELTRARPLLGTRVELRVVAATADAAHAAIDAGFRAVSRVQSLMSFHDPASDLSRIHADAWRQPVAVDASTWRVLRFAQALSRATDGVFDVTTAGALVRAGRLPHPAGAPSPVEDASWRDLRLGPDHTVQLRRPVLVDLGGIAKGFAIDRAIAAMDRAGAIGCAVDAGGDLRIRSADPQPVMVRHPGHRDMVLPLADVWNAAVATSAPYPDEGDGPWSGIVDPRSGRALDPGTSVTVIATGAMLADALTKIVAVAPSDCAPIVRRLGGEAVVVRADGRANHLANRRRGWSLRDSGTP